VRAIRATFPTRIGRTRIEHECLWSRLLALDVYECQHGYSVPAMDVNHRRHHPPLEDT
jgi:hypothetical protein